MKKLKVFEDFDYVLKELPGEENNLTTSKPSSHEEVDNYMFFANLKNICNMAQEILSMDKSKIDQMLTDEHDWATDHVSSAKENLEHVHDWLKSQE